MSEKTTPFIKRKIFGRIPVLSLAGLGLGIIGGYLYYYFIGCNSGTCPITSNPNMSMLWGAAIGYLLFDMFIPSQKKENK
ncbi:MAG: DUF6132 family protein [Bacteroidales bacterium]|nr:DUF6132 family protein [Bacteroidales bacterium]